MPAALDKEAARAPGRDLPPAKADQETEPKASVRKAEAKASVKEAARAPGRDLRPAKADQEPVPKASVRKAEAKASVKEAARAPGREEEPDRAGQPDNTALAKKNDAIPAGDQAIPGESSKKCLSFSKAA